MTEAGLRERSKAKRRAAIQHAAFRLFAEQGYDATTVAEIAAEAEVSPRTVALYFPSKADIALSHSDAIAARLAAVFDAMPGAGFLDVIDRWLTGEEQQLDLETARLDEAMNHANPGMTLRETARMTQATQVGSAALIEQVGLAGDDPMLAVIGGATGAAITQYFAVVAAQGPSKELHRRFMRVLRAILNSARPRR